jgi:hypothetical protein
LELDNYNSSGIISRPFIRLKIEINTSLPLASGFFMPCEGSKPRWIAFKYEHLDEYCSTCGLIGHIKKFCSAPPAKRTPEKYKFCLRAAPYVRPSLMPQPQQEDSDSGVSSAASVGNSPSCLSPSRPLDPPCSNFGQLVPRNQLDSHGSSTNLFSLQHVDSPGSSVPTQPNQLLHQWESSSYQHPLGRYPSKGTPHIISLQSKQLDWPYPTLNDPTSNPYLYHFTPPTTQLAPCSSSRSHPTTNPFNLSPAGSFPSLLPHAPSLFNTILHNWAQNPNNPSLLDKSPSPFQVGSNVTNSSSFFVEPIIKHPLDLTINRKLSTYKHSRFRPYETTRPLNAILSTSHSITHHNPHILDDPQPLSPIPPHTPALSTQTEKNATLPPTSSPSPFNTSTCSSVITTTNSLPFEVPAIISRGKGKSKLILDEDDLPLAQLKKAKTEKLVSNSSISDFSDVEGAALSLTKLHGDPFFKGPVHKFLTTPILDRHGHMVDFMPPYGGGFDALGVDSQHGRVPSKVHHSGGGFVAHREVSPFPNKEVFPPYVPAICGAFSSLQVPHTVRPASLVETDLPSDHLAFHPAPVPSASVAAMRRFVRAPRGRRLVPSLMGSTVDLNQPTVASAVTTLSDVDVLGECPVRPPP